MVTPTAIVGKHGIVTKQGKTAIKNYNNRENFLRELLVYKILANHPYIPVLMIDDFNCDNSIRMECMDGNILDLFSESIENRISYTEIMISNISSAVNYMESVGISHCDIKPSNIFYKRYCNSIKFKIADFSFSRTRALYKSLYVPQYRSIEMLFGVKGDSYFSDIWAFGISCLDLLIGERLIKFEKIEDILVYIFQQRENHSINGQLFFDSVNQLNNNQSSYEYDDIHFDNHRFDVRNILIQRRISCPEELIHRIENMLLYIPYKRFMRKDTMIPTRTKLLTDREFSLPNHIEDFISENIEYNIRNFKVVMVNIRDGLMDEFKEDLSDEEIWVLSIYLSSLLSYKIIDINNTIYKINKIAGSWIDRPLLLSKLKYLGSRFFNCIDV